MSKPFSRNLDSVYKAKNETSDYEFETSNKGCLRIR